MRKGEAARGSRWPLIKRCRRAGERRSRRDPAATRPYSPLLSSPLLSSRLPPVRRRDMGAGRRRPLSALLLPLSALLPLACAALAPRTLTGKQLGCLLPADEGPCRALVPRWYYDRYTQSCQEFTYGGCHGNANNFLTFDDCEKRCWTIKKVPKICRLEADGGPCRSHLRRFAFNLSSMRCEEFIYGGCYGNANNFRDLQSCVDHCLPEKTGPLLCYSPKDEGLCSSSVPRYYYDSKAKACKEFKYSGCGGNANNFVSEADCYNVCRKAGTQKPRLSKAGSAFRRRMEIKLVKRPHTSHPKS